MRYSKIYKCDMVNGEGLRVSLFLTGCSFACPGCFNKDLWNPKSGEEFTFDVETKLIGYLQEESIEGLTLLGGDPMHKANYSGVISLCKYLKDILPEKTIWMYTGYTLEELKEDVERSKILEYIDVLVDGKYEQDKKVGGEWYGSSNQRVIRL